MLHDLNIENFKGWEKTEEFRTAPMTLLFGSNSSGKSSIGQFILMLKQTAESQDRNAIFYPGDESSIVNLGSYQDMVHDRNINSTMLFSYTWDFEKTLAIRNTVSKKMYRANCAQFTAKIQIGQDNVISPSVMDMKYDLYKYDKQLGYKSVFSVGMRKNIDTKKGAYSLYTDDYNMVRNRGRVWAPGSPIKFYGFPDEVASYYQNADFTKALNLENEKLFRSIFYLGPMRTKALRLYPWSGIKPESVGYTGKNTISAILAASDRSFNFAPKTKTQPFVEIIAESLKQMDLIEDFKLRKISQHRQEYEVNIKTKGSNSWVDLPDVGFGISQVLPVIVQLFYAPQNSIIIMEQPEIHLHPKAQSDLADIMIKALKSRENAQKRNIQLIIETHSEHFLRRLQRRIAEERIPQDNIVAYFSNTHVSPPELDALKIDQYGNISNWPKDFFGDEMRDITAQAKAGLLKRKRARQGGS